LFFVLSGGATLVIGTVPVPHGAVPGFRANKAEPAGRVPPDAILFVQAATKRMQKRPFSLRRASPLPDFITFEGVAQIKNPALGKGLPGRGLLQRKAKNTPNQHEPES